jgi:hypothetical protein
MRRTALPIFVLLSLLPACGGSDATKTPASNSSGGSTTPAAAEKPKASADAAPKPADPVKVQTDAAKPAPADAAKPTADAAKSADGSTPSTDAPKATTSTDMDTAYKDLMAKPEVADDSIEIQHILIGFKGAPRLVNVTRSKDEAKALAQKVFDDANNGGDFDALVKQYTNDSAPGIYPLTKAGRARMVKSFGDVGFRLKVGEIGVAVWDATASPFGWHIIKRLK